MLYAVLSTVEYIAFGPMTFVVLPELPPMFKLATVPVRPVPAPENDVDDNVPVDGLNVSFVEDTLAGKFPELVVTHVGNIVAAVVVSFVILIFVVLVAFVAEVAVVAVVALPDRAPVNVVAVTDVNPAKVRLVAPRAMFVEPMVNDEFVS